MEEIEKLFTQVINRSLQNIVSNIRYKDILNKPEGSRKKLHNAKLISVARFLFYFVYRPT